MQPPLPRLTVRRLMGVVLVAALVAEWDSWRRRAPYCRGNADRCTSAEQAHLRLAASHERISALYRKLAADPRGSARYNNEQAALFSRVARAERAEAERAAGRGEAFRRAAKYPWVSLPPGEVDPMGLGSIDREGPVEESAVNQVGKPRRIRAR